MYAQNKQYLNYRNSYKLQKLYALAAQNKYKLRYSYSVLTQQPFS